MNKPRAFFIFVFAFVVLGLKGASDSYFGAEFMTTSDAEKKWGVVALASERFKSGDMSKRAPMAVDIIKRSTYIGQSRKSVRHELGDPDSYFFSDTIYAYKIMEYPGENTENWHLVFIPDDKLEKIREVKIHKKCCYQFPPLKEL